MTRAPSAAVAALSFVAAALAQHLPVPPLPYAYDSLEPWIDAATMKVHHLGHHAAYTKQVNGALEVMRADPNMKHLAKMGIDELLHHLDEVPEQHAGTIRNAGGGYVNHDLWWKSLSPWGGVPPTDASPTIQERRFKAAVDRTFGSVDKLKDAFGTAAAAVFGSGWTFLYFNKKARTLEITNTAGHDTPAMDPEKAPLLLLDMWEHAYYLKHQNMRAAYVDAFWHVVDWPAAATRYALASGEVAPEPLPAPDAREKQRVGLVPTDERAEAVAEL